MSDVIDPVSQRLDGFNGEFMTAFEACTLANALVRKGFRAGGSAGCFPYVTSYVCLESPGFAHRRAPCCDGAPMGVAHEKSGVSFELTLEPHAMSRLNWAYLNLRAPRGVAISIPEHEKVRQCDRRRHV